MNELEKVREFLQAHGEPPRQVYFDHENSGWVPPEIIEYMTQYYNVRGYGHPSITNKPGWEALEALLTAKNYIAETLNVEPGEIVFTHSGTEANNLAILGAARANKRKAKKIIVSAIEHYSVLLPAKELVQHGYKVVHVPVDEEGYVELDVLASLVDKDTFMVSIQTVNHEIGTIQPIREVVEIVRDRNPETIIHSDMADAYTRIPLDLSRIDVDLATLSSHKILGPKGAGALVVRNNVEIKPILYGALSTEKLWPGVENIPAIMGFYYAAKLAYEKMGEYTRNMARLRDNLIEGILGSVKDTKLNGPRGKGRAPDNVNISFLHVEGEALTVELSLRGIYVSSGSACT
ncbi:MAG: cysteine desulfurase, partial [Crenarchaeota archaeon]|nr:cysteine desulfurase [Thermoproteota archaeon]